MVSTNNQTNGEPRKFETRDYKRSRKATAAKAGEARRAGKDSI